jgi:putative transferase (TIGR04331 family)
LVARTLITTADEQTWPVEEHEPVLFLGEWCKRYSRKGQWEKFNSEILPYHWDDRNLLYEDYKYLQVFYEELLLELSQKLNQIHETNHSLRYWRIFIGPWLGYFTQILFDRWKSIQDATNNYELSKTILREDYKEPFVPNDMAEFMKLAVKKEWNHYIYANILTEHTNVPCILTNYKSVDNESESSSNYVSSKKKKEAFFTLCDKISNPFRRDDDAFFLNTYLTRIDEVKLHLRMSQLPILARKTPIIKSNFDGKKRNWNLCVKNCSEFELFVRNIISRQIPTIYLEGYTELTNQATTLSWPTNPKVIFTSNSYSTDDVFKVYAAEKTEQGSPLVIGQHGGGIGTHLWAFYEEHQITISDSYLSWGWTEPSMPKVKPVGQLKKHPPLGMKHNEKDGITLVTTKLPLQSFHIYSAPMASQALDYFDDQFKFVEALVPEIRDAMTVRLKADDYGWDPSDRWRSRFPDIKLDEGNLDIKNLIKKSRIYVSTYNATTFLESFTMNIPTVMYWNTNHWELRNSAIPYFNKLRDVGIFHETPESAAKHVNMIWEDVDLWWKSDEVQEALEFFMKRFSYLSDDLLDRVELVLQKEIMHSKKTDSNDSTH